MCVLVPAGISILKLRVAWVRGHGALRCCNRALLHIHSVRTPFTFVARYINFSLKGVSGPWYLSFSFPQLPCRLTILILCRWYGVGGTIQVAMFGMVASKVKQNANGAHTFLEVRIINWMTFWHVHLRLDCQGPIWDKCSHSLYILWIFVYLIGLRFSATYVLILIFDCRCLIIKIVGGSATVNALTGMNTIAACFLLPIGIAVYVIFGGLRATFICDWSHTIILFIIIYIFTFRA